MKFEGNKSRPKSIANDFGEEVAVEGSGMGKKHNEGPCLENATMKMKMMFVCWKLKVCYGCWFNCSSSKVVTGQSDLLQCR
ncbi:hypothetical protein MTR_7g405930 [Medicago truncatula]|uniref:Uncharacterized protein n=1 Tax=Medicago truncatula TaxID=3880 RepID=A0A072TWB8_MEDTR|nr:hypothetical protein MTR_7g405930 [Medicago truncatula]